MGAFLLPCPIVGSGTRPRSGAASLHVDNMGYRDQLTRLFKTRIADGAPLQHIREEFADGLHGLLVGADMFRLHMLMARCPAREPAGTSNYPTDDVHALMRDGAPAA